MRNLRPAWQPKLHSEIPKNKKQKNKQIKKPTKKPPQKTKKQTFPPKKNKRKILKQQQRVNIPILFPLISLA
jgi:hypothetical protein